MYNIKFTFSPHLDRTEHFQRTQFHFCNILNRSSLNSSNRVCLVWSLNIYFLFISEFLHPQVYVILSLVRKKQRKTHRNWDNFKFYFSFFFFVNIVRLRCIRTQHSNIQIIIELCCSSILIKRYFVFTNKIKTFVEI